MTPEESAAQILIEGVARVQSVKLVLATFAASGALAVLVALAWRWTGRTDKIRFYKARDVEARELVEQSIDTINRQGSELRRYRNLLLEADLYFAKHKPTFDDREREPLVASIKALLGERQQTLQITFERRDDEARAA